MIWCVCVCVCGECTHKGGFFFCDTDINSQSFYSFHSRKPTFTKDKTHHVIHYQILKFMRCKKVQYTKGKWVHIVFVQSKYYSFPQYYQNILRRRRCEGKELAFLVCNLNIYLNLLVRCQNRTIVIV